MLKCMYVFIIKNDHSKYPTDPHPKECNTPTMLVIMIKMKINSKLKAGMCDAAWCAPCT